MPNRLAIFSVYDKNGEWYKYRSFLLSELCSVASRVIVVINGFIQDEAHSVAENYGAELIVRENKGFDAGAYRDALVDYVGWRELIGYDELILCNDTFFGPFIPLTDIFETMAQREVDLWGLHYEKTGLIPHIYSFFYVFRNQNSLLKKTHNYFVAEIDPKADKIGDIYIKFEREIFKTLTNEGFIAGGFTEENPYSPYSNGDMAIAYGNLPILKKKFFSICNNKENILHALKQIHESTIYDVDMILEIEDLSEYGIYCHTDVENAVIDESKIDKSRSLESKITATQLRKYIGVSDRVYIYGIGGWGVGIYYYYLRDIEKFGGFIVSNCAGEERSYGYSIRAYSDEYNKKNVIAALSKKNTEEIIAEQGIHENWLYLW